MGAAVRRRHPPHARPQALSVLPALGCRFLPGRARRQARGPDRGARQPALQRALEQPHRVLLSLRRVRRPGSGRRALRARSSSGRRAAGWTRSSGAKGFLQGDGIGVLVEGFEHHPAVGIPYNHAYYGRADRSRGILRLSATSSPRTCRATIDPAGTGAPDRREDDGSGAASPSAPLPDKKELARLDPAPSCRPTTKPFWRTGSSTR